MLIPDFLLKKEKLKNILEDIDIEFYHTLQGYDFKKFKKIYQIKQRYPSVCLYLEDYFYPDLFTINHDKSAIITIPINHGNKEISYRLLKDNSIELEIKIDNKLYFFTNYNEEFLLFQDSYEAFHYFKDNHHVRFV